MKIFLCGQKSLGAAVLDALTDAGHDIIGIAPPPQKQHYDKLYVAALKKSIPVVKDCERLRSTDIPCDTDLVVAAHSHWMISDKVIARARYGAIGVHPSLLPRHRGRDAVRWTAAMRDPVAGVTVYWLDGRCDGGDIIQQKHLLVQRDWDYHDLWRELFPLAVEATVESVGLIGLGIAPRIPQDENVATWEPAFETYRLPRYELMELPGGQSHGWFQP